MFLEKGGEDGLWVQILLCFVLDASIEGKVPGYRIVVLEDDGVGYVYGWHYDMTT